MVRAYSRLRTTIYFHLASRRLGSYLFQMVCIYLDPPWSTAYESGIRIAVANLPWQYLFK